MPIDAVGERPEVGLGRLFKNLHQSMRLAMEESMRQEGIDLSLAHFVTLYTLISEQGVAGAELARRAFVTAQTMNTILRRLESEGSIKRVPHPSNQRADSWHVTAPGQTRFDKARVVAESVWSRMFESFTRQEVAQLEGFLQRCLGGLERQTVELRAAKSHAGSRRNKPVKRVRRG